jgi:hypothetical protein
MAVVKKDCIMEPISGGGVNVDFDASRPMVVVGSTSPNPVTDTSGCGLRNRDCEDRVVVQSSVVTSVGVESHGAMVV